MQNKLPYWVIISGVTPMRSDSAERGAPDPEGPRGPIEGGGGALWGDWRGLLPYKTWKFHYAFYDIVC